jgi:A/G-specific adenine glycosylase
MASVMDPLFPSFPDDVIAWYDGCGRDLPWRAPDAGAWAVLVSEVMLQQTPVARVLPAYRAWLGRWPTPAALAAAAPGDAVRMWGKLGYPRRALRLHACVRALVERHGGAVPSDVAELESLPGVGPYTARAVAVFAHGARHPVVDTNVRRVLARFLLGRADAGSPSARRDHARLAALLPDEPRRAARFSVAMMELGALVCTARAPRCGSCPLAPACAWRLAGSPPRDGPAPRSPTYAGSDRQVRGLLLEVLRTTDRPVPQKRLDAVWPKGGQRARALDGLVADGLVDRLPQGRFALPA